MTLPVERPARAQGAAGRTGMTLRQSFEAVLRKHLEINEIGLRGVMGNYRKLEKCVDDLLALSPVPSRERLHHIILDTIPNGEHIVGACCNLPNKEEYHHSACQALMVWASSAPQQWWCSDMRLRGETWWFEPSSEPNAGSHPVPSTWQCCPICTTPQPHDP